MASSRGRPRLASRELLQEAAFELFQVQGYRKTTVAQIARTAGFSRATFFNFFDSKAELFWVETDELIDRLSASLARLGRERTCTPAALRAAILSFAETLDSSSIPWALQNYHLIGAAEDLVASGAGRVLRITSIFQAHLGAGGDMVGPAANASEVVGSAEAMKSTEAMKSAEAAVLTALLLTALRSWIDGGVARGTLAEHLRFR